ncbi:MAG: DoxX family protein [Steroidobacteraceae bacterium]
MNGARAVGELHESLSLHEVTSMDVQELLWLTGRAFLGGLFAVAGIRHCFILQPLTQALAARGVPAPRFVLMAGTALQTAAGAALAFGIYPLLAVVCLITFTLTASALLLNFWSLEGAERINAVNAWWSNIGVIGGLLVVAAHTLGNT